MIEWTDSTNLEAPALRQNDPKKGSWPATGRIEARNLTARYRKGLPRVLKGLDFVVENCQKVGIVGRTGSGKSTLILSLLRILEQDLPESPTEP